MVYYAATPLTITVARRKGIGRKKSESQTIRLQNCIYKPWMEARSTERGSNYDAYDQITAYSPEISIFSEEQRKQYTLPFQQLE